jgi:hypothetical protein
MTRDQELPGSAGVKRFDSHQDWSDDSSVNSVYADGVYRVKTRKRLSLRTRKRDVPSEFLYRAPGLDAAHNVPLRQRLVFETDLGLHEDSHVVQAAQYSPRQGKPTTRKHLLFFIHLSASVLQAD